MVKSLSGQTPRAGVVVGDFWLRLLPLGVSESVCQAVYEQKLDPGANDSDAAASGQRRLVSDTELDTVGRQFEPYRWRPCGVTWDAVPEQSLSVFRRVTKVI